MAWNMWWRRGPGAGRWDGRASMPKIAEQTRVARRDQIVAAALACFARTGYHATTMADVAAQAGVSKGTPYLYFDSKQALFIALHEEWDCGLADRANAAAVRAADTHTHEQLEGLFTAGIQAGQWPAGTDPALAARLFTASLYGLMAQWHLAPGSSSWDAAAAALADGTAGGASPADN